MSQIFDFLARIVDILVQTLGHTGIFLGMLIESSNIPLPSEVIMPLGGYLAAIGKLNFWKVIFAGTLGNIVGSTISYYIGSYGGRPFIKKFGKYVLLSESHLDLADRWFKKHGESTVFFGRLLPVVRTFISLPAGISKMPFTKFIIFTAIGCIPWNWFLAWLGYKLGENLGWVKPILHNFNYVIAALLAIGIFFFLKKGLEKK